MVLFLDSNAADKPNRGDITFTTISMANWSMIEICASILCACLPTLKPLIMRIVPNFSSRSGTPATDWHDDVAGMAGYERPLTIGTRPSRRNRNLFSARDLLASLAMTDDGTRGPNSGVDRRLSGADDVSRDSDVELGGARRLSCASCSDGASLHKGRMREEEYALEDMTPVDREDPEAFRDGARPLSRNEKPLQPSASDPKSATE